MLNVGAQLRLKNLVLYYFKASLHEQLSWHIGGEKYTTAFYIEA